MARSARAPAGGTAVAAYKAVLRQVLDARPSGTRQRLAGVLGKNRSFVSQIANPAYQTPIPARHLTAIFETCRFSDTDKQRFLTAYAEAHPRHREAADRPAPFRTRKIKLPDLGDEARNAKLDRLVEAFVRDLMAVADKN